MSLVTSRKELSERITALELELSESETALAGAASALETAQTETIALTQTLTAEREAHAATSAELELAQETLGETSTALDEATGALANFDSEVDTAVRAKVHAELQSLGHDILPEGVTSGLPGTADSNEAATFESIDDPAEAYTFARANRANILKAEYARK